MSLSSFRAVNNGPKVMASVLASAVVPMISGAMWAPDVLAALLLLVAIGLGIWGASRGSDGDVLTRTGRFS